MNREELYNEFLQKIDGFIKDATTNEAGNPINVSNAYKLGMDTLRDKLFESVELTKSDLTIDQLSESIVSGNINAISEFKTEIATMEKWFEHDLSKSAKAILIHLISTTYDRIAMEIKKESDSLKNEHISRLEKKYLVEKPF